MLSAVWQMNQRDHNAVCGMAQIIALLYGPYFLKARLSTAASRHDQNFYYNLKWYISVDRGAAHKGLESVCRHLWYLIPQKVILCLVDDGVSCEEKRAVANVLLGLPAPYNLTPGKPDFRPVTNLLRDTRPCLSEFVTETSWLTFKLFREETAQHQSPAYMELQDLLRDLKVVNDSAEHAVKDVQEYANATGDINHIDNVILVGRYHRCVSHICAKQT